MLNTNCYAAFLPMPKLGAVLDLDTCPRCGVTNPMLARRGEGFVTTDYEGKDRKYWGIYLCTRCGGVVTAFAGIQIGENGEGKYTSVGNVSPTPEEVDTDLPERARSYLAQAKASLHAPSGAVMLAASAVDAMLKNKNYRKGSLYTRIDKAAEDHVITSGMAEWAHDVRLDANDQRHADEEAELPQSGDARHCIDFATALGQFLFVLPARVERGKNQASRKSSSMA